VGVAVVVSEDGAGVVLGVDVTNCVDVCGADVV
jgi:hypothetical protein